MKSIHIITALEAVYRSTVPMFSMIYIGIIAKKLKLNRDLFFDQWKLPKKYKNVS